MSGSRRLCRSDCGEAWAKQEGDRAMSEDFEVSGPEISRRKLLQYGLAAGGAFALGGSGLESASAAFARLGAGGPFKGPVSKLKPYNPNAPAGQAPPSSIPRSMAWVAETDTAYWL